jgi:hypothetical protein
MNFVKTQIMKLNYLTCILLTTSCIIFYSCYKEPIDYSKEITDLKAEVTALKKKSDSLSIALNGTNSGLSNLGRSVDSIKSQLTIIVTQINQLNSQITNTNANITVINAQIIILNQQYATLLAQLNAILAQLSISQSTLSNGLVAYYPFTGNAADSSGNGNNGIINTGVLITTDRLGKPNSAYNFSGGTITIPHKTYLSITQGGQFTIGLWVNKSGNQNPVHIIGKRAQGANAFNWQLGQHTSPGGLPGGGLVFTGVTSSISTGIDYNGIKDSIIQINKWEHLVGTFDNGNWNLYKNGKLVAQKNSTFYAPDSGNPSLEIGNAGGWGAFWGKIDDIRIYNRVITQQEITYLANN